MQTSETYLSQELSLPNMDDYLKSHETNLLITILKWVNHYFEVSYNSVTCSVLLHQNLKKNIFNLPQRKYKCQKPVGFVKYDRNLDCTESWVHL